jgi:hypothetical protein
VGANIGVLEVVVLIFILVVGIALDKIDKLVKYTIEAVIGTVV